MSYGRLVRNAKLYSKRNEMVKGGSFSFSGGSAFSIPAKTHEDLAEQCSKGFQGKSRIAGAQHGGQDEPGTPGHHPGIKTQDADFTPKSFPRHNNSEDILRKIAFNHLITGANHLVRPNTTQVLPLGSLRVMPEHVKSVYRPRSRDIRSNRSSTQTSPVLLTTSPSTSLLAEQPGPTDPLLDGLPHLEGLHAFAPPTSPIGRLIGLAEAEPFAIHAGTTSRISSEAHSSVSMSEIYMRAPTSPIGLPLLVRDNPADEFSATPTSPIGSIELLSGSSSQSIATQPGNSIHMPGSDPDAPGKVPGTGSNLSLAGDPPIVNPGPTVGWYINGRTALGSKFTLVPMTESGEVSMTSSSSPPSVRVPKVPHLEASDADAVSSSYFRPRSTSPSDNLPAEEASDTGASLRPEGRIRTTSPHVHQPFEVITVEEPAPITSDGMLSSPPNVSQGRHPTEPHTTRPSVSSHRRNSVPGSYDDSIVRLAEDAAYRGGARLAYLRGEQEAWHQVTAGAERAGLKPLLAGIADWGVYNDLLCKLGEEWY
ncbi:hypothetical protein K466DRAFT_570120 [Polyporus arcularius HHB13444]|uniref:Uncharacterized protein n=1 Tax=Polyporus arcularius HHB13444 TaxID=1314778 RepID=A0A5C3NQI1_9APHY|nr:hypothetical protein K466DRAFT_570120 [Polyporus arcularius HHB13444]